jgi:hypothetical protein
MQASKILGDGETVGDERILLARAGAAPEEEAERWQGARGGPRARFPCPRCSGNTRLVPNPYYGIGLSVNREIRLCTRCEWACSATGTVLAAGVTAPAEALESRRPEQTGPLNRARAVLARMFGPSRVRSGS